MKKLIYILLSLTMVLGLTACTVSNSKNYEVADMSAYDNLKTVEKLGTFYKLDDEVLKEKLENEDSFLMLIAYPSCSWCQKGITIVNDLVLENKTEVFYLNVEESTEETFNILTEELTPILEAKEGDSSIYTPTLVAFKKGEAVDVVVGGIPSSEEQYTETERASLLELYQNCYNSLK